MSSSGKDPIEDQAATSPGRLTVHPKGRASSFLLTLGSPIIRWWQWLGEPGDPYLFRTLRTARENLGYVALAGFQALVLAWFLSLALWMLRAVAWLRDGYWREVTMRQAFFEPGWIQWPSGWIGVQRILNDTLDTEVSKALFLVGLVILVGSLLLFLLLKVLFVFLDLGVSPNRQKDL